MRALILFAILVAVVSPAGDSFTIAAPGQKPNIIFILTDDLDAKSIEVMPKLKSLLIDRGVTFSNFFISYPLCCPSRASILRGQYAHNTGVQGNRPPIGGFEKFYELGRERSTIATWLQAAGYRTGYFGKYLNGYPAGAAQTYVPPGWDEWNSPVTSSAYRMFDYRMNENGRIASYGSQPDDYITDVLAAKAAAFIRQGGKPFFIHLATYAPHQPATPAPRHAAMFPGARVPQLPSFNEPDISDKPQWLRRPQLTPRQIARMDQVYRRRLQSLQAVDDLIGMLVDTLRATGELQRTYIFFSSDNGFHLGEHRLPAGKNTPYDEDIRVPLIIVGPGVPAGRSVAHLAVNIDLAQTWADLAGATVSTFVDGRSLVPLLTGTLSPSDQWRRAFLIEHVAQPRVLSGNHDPEPPDDPASPTPIRLGAVPSYSGLRTRDYTYVEYATGERELYDLRRDPFELNNLAARVDQRLLTELSARLDALRRCTATSCRTAENTAVPPPPIALVAAGTPRSTPNSDHTHGSSHH